MKKFLIDKKNQLILLLCALLLIKMPQEDLRFVLWVLAGASLAAGSDILINRLFLKQYIIPSSAVISGAITAGIVDYRQPWFVLVIFSLLAILSKYIIRYKARHIFNPANFSLFVATLFGVPLTWNIESNIYIIIAFGIYIAYSIRKIPHVFGFLVFFAALFASGGINPLTLISWFFVFVMLVEPKTSGFGRLRGFIFGSIAGISSFLIFKFFPRNDIFVSPLFIANFFNPLLEKIKKIERIFLTSDRTFDLEKSRPFYFWKIGLSTLVHIPPSCIINT